MYLPLLPTTHKLAAPATHHSVMHSTGVPLAGGYRPEDTRTLHPIAKHVEWLPVTCDGIVVYVRRQAAPLRGNRLLPIF